MRGIVNTDPNICLNATFSPVYPPEGRVAMLSQSGALGLAILDYARRLNLGISTFVSVGNKPDVSGNDLLQYWENDPRTDVILLYLESFGNPRNFGHIARRVSRSKPIAIVKAGRSRAGARAASSHTGALAESDAVVGALLRQSGVIRTRTLEELFDIAALLANQALPAGRRVAIVTNAGGPGILAADACEAYGLGLHGGGCRFSGSEPRSAAALRRTRGSPRGGCRPLVATRKACRMLLRGLIVWLVLMCVAIGNGAFRVAVLVPRFGERAGRVVSTLMLCAEIGLVAWAAIRWIHPGTATRALAVGALWLALTLLFEFGFGRLRGRSWEELMADYHVLRGRIWVLVPATTFVAPYLTAAARGVLGGGSQARSPGRGLRRRDSRSRDSSSIA